MLGGPVGRWLGRRVRGLGGGRWEGDRTAAAQVLAFPWGGRGGARRTAEGEGLRGRTRRQSEQTEGRIENEGVEKEDHAANKHRPLHSRAHLRAREQRKEEGKNPRKRTCTKAPKPGPPRGPFQAPPAKATRRQSSRKKERTYLGGLGGGCGQSQGLGKERELWPQVPEQRPRNARPSGNESGWGEWEGWGCQDNQ